MKRTSVHPARGSRAFTAIEALISVTLLSVIVLITVTLLQNSQKTTRRATVQGDSQQSARVASDILTTELRATGYGVDVGQGQLGIVHAGPWDVIVNANIRPDEDDPISPSYPRAMNISVGPASVPPGGALYNPPLSYLTGAETIRYTLDSNGDGAITPADNGDDLEEGTPNPRDYVLRREVYGMREDNTNGGDGETVAIVRGPEVGPDNVLPYPLFTYWYDHDEDRATGSVLFGDIDGNGELSQSEINSITPVTQTMLPLVDRVVITVTSEDGESSGKGTFRSRTLVSQVSIRAQRRKTAVITGIVYQDSNGNKKYDDGESPIPRVPVRLTTGQIRTTDGSGMYAFGIPAGQYTVIEIDPTGYSSTSPNAVPVDAEPGKTYVVDFGDKPAAGIGYIKATVFFDADADGKFDGKEKGIENVVVSLASGVSDSTDVNGEVLFEVPIGTHTVSASDSAGYTSTTSNQVEVTVQDVGDEEEVEFGDTLTGTGTIDGIVYLDLDADGKYDGGEPGISNVPIYLSSGDSTLTDSGGEFEFVVPVGTYDVIEYDLAAYSSSTPNVESDVEVKHDKTVTVEFGDVFDGPVGLSTVSVSSTDHALSLATIDLREDGLGDVDIVLGTQPTTGNNNLLVWHNKRTGPNTPPTNLFDVAPTITRNAAYTVPVLEEVDSNADGYPDVVTGLATNADSNLRLWVNQSGSTEGSLPMFPSGKFRTSVGSSVRSIEPVNWPGWSQAMAVGTESGTGQGHVEFWANNGGNAWARLSAHDITEDAQGSLGEVNSMAVADFNGDGYPDLAIGQDTGGNQGRVGIFLANPSSAWNWTATQVIVPDGAVYSLKAVDMVEDSGKDADLVIGTSKGAYAGTVELWLNDGAAQFGAFSGSYWERNNWFAAGGEVLSMDVKPLDADVFPEVIVGVRKKQYGGALDIYRTFGDLPDTVQSSHPSGEVVALSVNDLNGDGIQDVVVGTRATSTSGELIVYIGQ